jgi:hypothetical protein
VKGGTCEMKCFNVANVCGSGNRTYGGWVSVPSLDVERIHCNTCVRAACDETPY